MSPSSTYTKEELNKKAVEEAFRTLRNNFQYSIVGSDKAKVIVITSPEKGDGKSTVSSNLAKTIAMGGKRVVVIDSDLRRPTLHKKIGISNEAGLVDVIVGEKKIVQVISEVEKNLYVITAGKFTANPSELLLSNKMRNIIEGIKESFDYIIVDTPPINIVSDTGTLLSMSDASMLVCKYRKTRKKELEKAAKAIEITSNNLIGVVLNSVNDKKDKSYYDYY